MDWGAVAERQRGRFEQAETAVFRGNQPLFKEHVYGPASRIVPPYVERVLAHGVEP